MDQKGHMIDQKGLKMYEKSQKMEFSDLKYLLFSGIFLSGIGGYPPPPLTENHPAQKPLAERGGTPRQFFTFLPNMCIFTLLCVKIIIFVNFYTFECKS